MKTVVEKNLELIDEQFKEVFEKYPNFMDIIFLKFDIETDLDLVYCEVYKDNNNLIANIDFYPNEYIKNYEHFKSLLEKCIQDRIIKITIYEIK